MLLPDTWAVARILLLVAVACFLIWPNLFKLVAASKWRYELFSLDFAIGGTILAVCAAYTYGSLGSELDFSDSMLVAGKRAELMALIAGVVFAIGNMLYLACISLAGLANGTLLTFSVFGCAIAALHITAGNYAYPGATIFLLLIAAYFSFRSSKVARLANPQQLQPSQIMSLNTKSTITGVAAGLAYAVIWPTLRSAQSEEFGIGAYAGLLLASIGLLIATPMLNLFLMNLSLEGGQIGFGSYVKGSVKNHVVSIIAGIIWGVGALALYTSKTGTVPVKNAYAYMVPFAAAILCIVCGIAFWQKIKLPAAATRYKYISLLLLILGSGLLAIALGVRQAY